VSQLPDSIGAAAEEGRIRLDRERILAAAEAIARREGVARLTMRRIGAELGADPTAVYRHFRNKRELLLQLADRLFDIRPLFESDVDWRTMLREAIRQSIALYRVNLELALLLAQQPDDTSSLERDVEATLAQLARAGLGPADAARAYRMIESHIVGTGLWHAVLSQPDEPRYADGDGLRRHYERLPAAEFPHLVEAAPHLFGDLDEAADLGTEAILDAVERMAREAQEEET
jgi:AcrR family transcriptional regulator